MLKRRGLKSLYSAIPIFKTKIVDMPTEENLDGNIITCVIHSLVGRLIADSHFACSF